MLNYQNKKLLKYIFFLYLIILIDLVVIKFFGNIDTVINRIRGIMWEREAGYPNLQLVPLKTITTTIRLDLIKGIGGPALINLLANIILFMPLGFLLPFLIRKSSLLKVIILSLLIIIGIELIQYVTLLGIADVDDIIMNITGSFIGYLLYKSLTLFYKKIH